MAVSIRRAGDAAEFAQFRELQLEYEASLPPGLGHELPELPALMSIYQEPGAVFLALLDGIAAGCVGVSNVDTSTNLIKRLYVRPACRKRGIARALVDAVIELSRDQQRRRIVLDTDRMRLSEAYQLYLSLGFMECEPYAQVAYASPTFLELKLL